MAIIHRLSRLFQADVNAVLDLIEEPHTLLRQAIREMEEALVADERALAARGRELNHLTTRRGRFQQTLEHIESELDLCFEAGEESLARGLVRRKLEAQRSLDSCQQRIEATEAALAEARQRVEDRCKRLAAMHEKADCLAAEVAEPGDETVCWPAEGSGVRDEDIEVALLRERQRRAQS